MTIDIRYILGLGLAALLKYLVGGITGNAIFWISLLLLGFAFLQYLLFSRALKIKVRAPEDRIEVGDDLRLALNLENRGLLTIPYIISEAPGLGDRRVISLPAGDKENVTFDLKPEVRGIVDVGTIRLKVTDVLNILTRTREYKPGQIKVYPRVREDSARNSVWKTVGEGVVFQIYSRENPYSVREMRHYQRGDSIRKINWKVSAKYNELFVKRGETTEEKNILIILDMNREILTMDERGIYENSLVTDALTLSKGLLFQGISHSVILNDMRQQLFNVTSLDSYSQLEEYLVLNKADHQGTLADFTLQKNEFLLERGTLVFFTRPLPRDIEAVEKLKHTQNEIILCAPHLAESGLDFEGREIHFRDLGGIGYDLDQA